MSAATVRTVGRAGAPARPGAPRTGGPSRATTRPSTRTATSRPAEGPRRSAAALRLVPQAPSQAARAPFVGVVVGLLALGLLGLLALNTSLAQNSFQLHALQGQAKVLADREQVVRQEVEALQAPEALASRAEALGMVPGGPPAFLRLSDGKVLGKPSPAPALPGLGAGAGSSDGAPGLAATAPAAGAPQAAASPAPERLLSRALAESGDGPDRASGTRSTASTGEQGAAAEGAAAQGAGEEGVSDDDRSATDRASDGRSTVGAGGDRSSGASGDRSTGGSEDQAVDDGAVDDGATDADDSTASDASTSTSDASTSDASTSDASTGARR